jgi:hypothetical protein
MKENSRGIAVSEVLLFVPSSVVSGKEKEKSGKRKRQISSASRDTRDRDSRKSSRDSRDSRESRDSKDREQASAALLRDDSDDSIEDDSDLSLNTSPDRSLDSRSNSIEQSDKDSDSSASPREGKAPSHILGRLSRELRDLGTKLTPRGKLTLSIP